jgi:hypothetical protein
MDAETLEPLKHETFVEPHCKTCRPKHKGFEVFANKSGNGNFHSGKFPKN